MTIKELRNLPEGTPVYGFGLIGTVRVSPKSKSARWIEWPYGTRTEDDDEWSLEKVKVLLTDLT